MQRISFRPTSLCLALILAALLVTNLQAQDLTPAERSSSATEPPDFEAIGNQLARRLPEIASSFFRVVGAPTVQTLTDSGLPQADSEAIAQRYASDFADCARSMFMIEAERQSVTINELLTRLVEVTYIGNVDTSDPAFDPIQNVSKVMDFIGMSANLESCVVGAMQEAGISYESGLEALSELPRRDSQ